MPTGQKIRSVAGKVWAADGRPVSNVRVVASDRDLRSEEVLGEALTNTRGAYEITYSAAAFNRGEKDSADLVLRAYTGTDVVAKSPTLFNSGEHETVDLFLAAEKQRSEYERLFDVCKPLLADVPPAELTEDDVEFLAGETEWETEQLRLFARAHRVGLDVKCAPELFYGCGREGLRIDIDFLCGLPPDEILGAVNRAIFKGVIPAWVIDQYESARNALADRAVRLTLGWQGDSTRPVGEIFKVALPNAAAQEAAARVWLSHQRLDEALWSKLSQEGKLSADQVKDVRATIEVASIVGTHAPLLEVVLAKTDIKSSGVEALAKLDLSDWTRLLEDTGVQPPKECPGDDESARLQFYAEGLQRTVEVAFPGAVLRRELGRSEFPASAQLAGLLEREPAVDLAIDNLETVAARLEKHAPLDEGLKEHLFSVGRLSRVAHRPFQAKALAEQGIPSAHAISEMDPEQFVNGFSLHVGGAIEAARIHRRASQISARVMGLLTRFRTDLNREVVDAVRDTHEAEPPAEWRSLFGEIDFCRCPECRSVLSPAAYLVDLLQFLRRRNGAAAGQRPPLDVLLTRRPDIGQLELSCANTTTLMPTIDIINELCENILVPGVLPTASRRPTEELVLRPEHVNDAAYEILAAPEGFPWTLPLDRPWEELRLHLPLVGCERWRLIEEFRSGDGASSFAAAADELNLSPSLARALVGDGGANASWGLGGDWVTALADSRTLLDRSGLSYEQLESVLATRFVRHGEDVRLVRLGAGCTLDQIKVTGLSKKLLGRLQVFVKIQRRSGWSIAELDDVLESLHATRLDEATLTALGHVQWLHRETGRPLSEISTWWGTLSTVTPAGRSRSAYEEVFFNPTRTTALNPRLRLTDDGKPVGEGEPLTDHTSSLRAALGATPSEFEALLEGEPDPTVNLRSLSALHGRLSLARVLGLAPSDLLVISRLRGSGPATPGGPEDVRRLFELARALAALGLPAKDLEPLLTGASVPGGPLPAHDTFQEALVALRTGLGQIDEGAAIGRRDATLVARLVGQRLRLDEALLGAALQQLRAPGAPPRVSILECLTDDLFMGGDDSVALPAIRHLQRCLELAARLKLAPADLPLVAGHGPTSWLNLDRLPLRDSVAPRIDMSSLFGKLVQTARFFARRARRTSGQHWNAIISAAGEGETAEELLTRTAVALGIDRAGATELAGPRGLAIRNDEWVSGEAILRIDRAWERMRQLGVSVEVGLSWVADDVSSTAAATAVEVARARSAASTWPSIARPLRDVLRERQRDALVAALTTSHHRSTADLSNRLLMDVEIAACQMTSRIQAAIASVQRFIDRCLQGLEEETALNSDARREWRWLRNYRVWELNRKVFLFPEDFLRPELRDDKSPFFVELEQEMMQQEITDARAEVLIGRYLERLDSVARLEVSGCYREELSAKVGLTRDRFHVVARSQGEPRSYWYRTFEDPEGWTPWEKIDLDIRAEQVVLTVADGRLYLCWPVFEERAYPPAPPIIPRLSVDTGNTGDTVHAGSGAGHVVATPSGGAGGGIEGAPARQGRASAPEPVKYLQVSLAYTRRSGEGWAPRKLADGTLRVDKFQRTIVVPQGRTTWVPVGDRPTVRGVEEHEIRLVADEVSQTVARVAADSVDLVIRCHVRDRNVPDGDIGVAVGEFRLGGCHGTFRAFQFDDAHQALDAVDPSDRRRPAILTTHDSVLVARGLESVKGVEPDTGRVPVVIMDEVETFPRLVDPLAPSDALYRTRNTITILRTRMPYRMVLPQNGQFFFDGPFFYEDERRTFFVRPYPVSRPIPEAPDSSFSALPSGASSLAIATQVERALEHTSYDWTVSETLSTSVGLDHAVTRVSQWLSETGGATSRPATIVARTVARWARGLPPLLGGGRLLFDLFSHPFVCDFMVKFRTGGVEALLARSTQSLPHARPAFDFAEEYRPVLGMVARNLEGKYPQEKVDFTPGGAYAIYNWELFVHIPFLIARQLQGNQRFEEAQRWYHFIFDPTQRGDEPAPGRYWNSLPFFEAATRAPVDELRELLTRPASDVAGTPGLFRLVESWRRAPFSPWRVAALRRMALPKGIVLAYIELLLDWGDSLFRQFTRETLNQASLLYMLAARLLGPRPHELPGQEPPPESFQMLRGRLDAFSNAIVRTEGLVPLDPRLRAGITDPSAIRALGTTFYFCIPSNPYLLGFWDRVEDRLFKIRHCQDIEGVTRQPPLFEEALELGALTSAGQVPTLLEAPLSQYRFPVLLSKALELAGEVRALGGALLGAIERRDGEELSRIRSTQELASLARVREVRGQQVSEAEAQLESLKAGRALIEHRRDHYDGLKKAGLSTAEFGALTAIGHASVMQGIAGALESGAAAAHGAPTGNFGVAGWGGTPAAAVEYGGENAGRSLEAAARALSAAASVVSGAGNLMSAWAGFERRTQDWNLQVEIADCELKQIGPQIKAAEARVEIARKELALHELQTMHAQTVDGFLRGKFSNLELYSWMVSQLSSLHFGMYQLALAAARRAERAYRFELAENAAFVNPGSWDSLRQGLLAGERLQLDLRRMEEAYLARNRRENELTKHISLALLDPMELHKLKTEGSCHFSLPEWLFDFDHPGHYMRRIKSVAVSLPAVVGPYTNVNGRLTLESHAVRVSEELRSRTFYLPDPRAPNADGRFRRGFGPLQSSLGPVQWSIATSRGHTDAGVFDVTLRDERYTPFEGAGVISQWKLDLEPLCNDFDPNTLSDVVIELAYTSRNGSDDFRQKCVDEVLEITPQEPRTFGLSAASDAPEQWHEFLHPVDATSERLELRLPLMRGRLPYRDQRGNSTIVSAQVRMLLADSSGRGELPMHGVPIALVNPNGEHLEASSLELRATSRNLLSCDIIFERARAFGEWRLSMDRGLLERLLSELFDEPPGRNLLEGLVDVLVFVAYR